LCSGKTSAFQADDAGSIPAARSKKPLPTNYLQTFVIVSCKLPTQLHFLGLKPLSSKLMTRVRFPPLAPRISLRFNLPQGFGSETAKQPHLLHRFKFSPLLA
jgi:hypothetical protein